MTLEEFLTIITQIEGILNSRPITPLSEDIDDLEVLTPGHFLIGRPITSISEPNLTSFRTAFVVFKSAFATPLSVIITSENASILEGFSSPVTNRGCNFSPSMNSTPSIANAASVVAQSKRTAFWFRKRASYNTKEALNISIASSDLGPSCKWTLLENLGSEHLPISIELKKRQLVPTNNNKQWIFKKTDWQSFAEAFDNGFKSIPLTDSVDLNWCSFKEIILRAAKKYIPRGLHYQTISRLNFSVEDRNIKIRTSRIVHGCCSDTHRGTSIFSRDFRVNELEAAIGDSCLNKSPGPDGIHGQMIDHLGLRGRQRVLDIINCSRNKGQLPRD
ncbi:hypothetical protein TNCV_1737951 [Trichonephila clavipes]|nr:hypothetical protein TNCV_1737951 [Trichonephila clavipes]